MTYTYRWVDDSNLDYKSSMLELCKICKPFNDYYQRKGVCIKPYIDNDGVSVMMNFTGNIDDQFFDNVTKAYRDPRDTVNELKRHIISGKLSKQFNGYEDLFR